MELGWSIGFSLLTSLLFLTLIFLVARWQRRYDIIDIAWGMAFIAIAAVALLGQKQIELWSIQTIATVLVVCWGLRLSVHIYSRWTRSKTEDKRYQELREKYEKKQGGAALNMYVRVFVIQAVLAVVIMLPVVLVMLSEPINPNWWVLAGILVWAFGFYFEAMADRQLAQHVRSGNKGLLVSGVWKVSRHPNYFGEATMWWGVWIMTIGTPYAWLGIISPIVITILVRFISGVPLTEKLMSRRNGWKRYAERTSVFFPLPPRKG